MQLSKQQLAIVQAQEPYCVVIASAAAGKTATLVERLRYLLNQGVDPTKIVTITFTNNAAQEMMERIGSIPGLIITTIHGYANYLLLSRGLDTTRYLNKDKFDELFYEVKQHPDCVKEVEYLLVDEFQDSPPIQYTFLLDMVQPKHWMVFGDPRQSIFQFCGAEPQLMIDLSRQPGVKTYQLNENYRNSRNILSYAKSIIQMAGRDYYDYSVPMRQEAGEVISVPYYPDGIVKAVSKNVDKNGNFGDWFILTRTNQDLDIMIRHLEKYDIPFNTFKRADLTKDELNQCLKRDTVKALTIHAAKGLEAKNVVVIGAKFFNLEEKCVSYVAATRAKDLLIWANAKPKRKVDKIQTNSWE